MQSLRTTGGPRPLPDPIYSRRHAHGIVSLVIEQANGCILIGIYGKAEQPIIGTLHGAQEMADNLAECPSTPMHTDCEPWKARRSIR